MTPKEQTPSDQKDDSVEKLDLDNPTVRAVFGTPGSEDKELFTPGPWSVEYCLDQTIFINAGGKPIAMIQSEDDEGMTPEMEANAKLIASAPQLKSENEKLKQDNERLKEEAIQWENSHFNEFGLSVRSGQKNAALREALEQLYIAVKDIPEVRDYMDGNLIQAKEALNKKD